MGTLSEPHHDRQGLCAGRALPDLTEGEAALDAFLEELFTSEGVIKTGFELAGDLKNLCRSYPHLRCFSQVRLVASPSPPPPPLSPVNTQPLLDLQRCLRKQASLPQRCLFFSFASLALYNDLQRGRIRQTRMHSHVP